jgi:hypothetical protein
MTTGTDVAVAVAVAVTDPPKPHAVPGHVSPENKLLASADSEEACALASESTFAPARSRLAIERWCIVGVSCAEFMVVVELLC